MAGNVGARGAASGDRVSIRYQAWLQSAQGRGILGEALQDEFLPAEFTLGHNAVIRGWEEGVSGMSVGCVRWLVVPPQLAYGDAGRPEASIPAHAVLVMRVHLVDLTEGQAAADRPLPVMGGVTIASAIKMLRPPTPEAGDDEWASGTPPLFFKSEPQVLPLACFPSPKVQILTQAGVCDSDDEVLVSAPTDTAASAQAEEDTRERDKGVGVGVGAEPSLVDPVREEQVDVTAGGGGVEDARQYVGEEGDTDVNTDIQASCLDEGFMQALFRR